MTSTYRVKFVYDTEAQFEECNGEARPLTEAEYKGNEYQKNGRNVPYAEYRNYLGNPERHVYLGCIVDRRCECCGVYMTVQSLWNIDCMDDSPELLKVRLDYWYAYGTLADFGVAGYLLEVANEMIAEAQS